MPTETYQDRVTDAVRREAVIIVEHLPVRLTDAEVLDVSRKSAELHSQCALLTAELKSVTSDIKGRIKEAEKDIFHLQNVIRSQQEYRDVQCEKSMHYDIAQVTLTRLDTGHVIETRPMTRDERQMEMDL